MVVQEIEKDDCGISEISRGFKLSKSQLEFLEGTCQVWIEFIEYTKINNIDYWGDTYKKKRSEMSAKIKQVESVLISSNKDEYRQLFQVDKRDRWKRSIFDQFMDKMMLGLSKTEEYSDHP